MAETTKPTVAGAAVQAPLVPRPAPAPAPMPVEPHHKRHAELHAKAKRNEGEQVELNRLTKRIAAEKKAP